MRSIKVLIGGKKIHLFSVIHGSWSIEAFQDSWDSVKKDYLPCGIATFEDSVQFIWDLLDMAGIPGCILIGIGILQCIFNPLHYNQDITTVTTKTVIIAQENAEIPEILFFKGNTWPVLKKVEWGSVTFRCYKEQCNKQEISAESSPVISSETTGTIETTILSETMFKTETTTVYEMTSLFVEGPPKTAAQHRTPWIRPKKTNRITHPHTPSPPNIKSTPRSVIRSRSTEMLSTTNFQIFRSTTSYELKLPYKLSSNNTSFKEILGKFKQEMEELIMSSLGAVFSAGTLLFIVRILYKNRKKLPCCRTEIVEELVQGGMHLLNQSVQTETSMLETDEEREMDGESALDRLEQGGAIGGGEQIERREQTEKRDQGTAEQETDRKVIVGEECRSMIVDEQKFAGGVNAQAQIPSAPLLSPLGSLKDTTNFTRVTRKSTRFQKSKSCELCEERVNM